MRRCLSLCVAACLAACLGTASIGSARSDDLYEFVVSCKAEALGSCFNRIRQTIDAVRAEEQGHAVCLPRSWYPVPGSNTGYPVSLLDYLLMRLSAARVSRPGHPHQAVMRDILGEMYPCQQHAKR